MPGYKDTLPKEQQAKLIELLNRRLVDTFDLQLQSRQAYRNINGKLSRTFASLTL